MCYVFPPCLLTFRTLCTKTSIISGFQGRRFSVLSSVQGNGGTILSSNHIYAAEAIDGDTWAFFQAACCLGFLFFLLLLYRYPEWDVPKRLRWPGWILSYNPGLYLFARECICFFFSLNMAKYHLLSQETDVRLTSQETNRTFFFLLDWWSLYTLYNLSPGNCTISIRLCVCVH